jgi:hypothetical protein
MVHAVDGTAPAGAKPPDLAAAVLLLVASDHRFAEHAPFDNFCSGASDACLETEIYLGASQQGEIFPLEPG